MDSWTFWTQADGLARAVALALLAMSVASWVVILWKTWLLRRAGRAVRRSVAAFWQAETLSAAQSRVQSLDNEGLVIALVQAAEPTQGVHLLAQMQRDQQLTQALRAALQSGLARLQHGQVLLATVGSTAPFVGLLGTVWGIYHALIGLAGAQQVSIDRVAAPVGEALIMTAAGLVVAIPAVLAYNVLGRWAGHIEAVLEGFAHDLRGLHLQAS